MLIFENCNELELYKQKCLPKKFESVLTIGNFDGVHLGHKSLIQKVNDKAKLLGVYSGAITFDPHPLHYFLGSNALALINSRKLKLEYLSRLGLDFVLVLKFDQAFATLEPEEFVKKYLCQLCAVKHLIIGYDYSFGKNRRGNFSLLETLGFECGFSIEKIEAFSLNQTIISSTRIRECLEQGNLSEIKTIMGRFYAVDGEVIHGFKRGASLLGFPTANLKHQGLLLPQVGVYACLVEYNGKLFQAVANLGNNPSFDNKELSLEVHILDFAEELYGKTLRVHFVSYLRGEKKFSNLEALVTQIKNDIEQARPILKKALVEF
ncbi:bifunctional riboflavin kinase/FAD synthetase [Desulfovibrio litoralis]|uniref:Riboflavin biosynthesis protein n=1 Tax=Desulfovibrio litoralis DSM 11393 TaxID=1121455 RepID=A0A1M7SA12_9BACT|nr:bifunctional riboflavin kinase/FAD synthetase [Desulfovibrio litoralis]SHN55326.1 riboflavin kinase / FMN adenylyltransferase [Desulfovibrio litoralis DSM 11393]